MTASAGNLVKTGSAAWNSGASSSQVISYGYGYVEFTATNNNTTRVIGLSSDDADTSYQDIDFAIMLRDDGMYKGYHREPSRYLDTFWGYYQPGDVFRITVDNGTITYSRNGQKFATEDQNAIPRKYPFVVDTALLTPGATLDNVVIATPPAWPAGPDFYVSPSGSRFGDGTLERPLDLATALASNDPSNPQFRPFKPGDTIWLQGGTYTGRFVSNLKGTATAPIVVRNFQGQRVTIDENVGLSHDRSLVIGGEYTWYWGLEVTDSSTARTTSTTLSHPADLPREASAVLVSGSNVKLIDMVIHDLGNGVFWETGSKDSEIYGSLIYNNGWDAPDRGHGHGIYAQNKDGTKRITDSIVFNQFGFGIHIYGSSDANINNFTLDGNVAFNNGAASAVSGYSENLHIGAGSIAQNPTVINNATYSPGREGANVIGYTNGLVAKGNYFASDLSLDHSTPTEFSGNTLWGRVTGETTAAQLPGNTYLDSSVRPKGTVVSVRPNLYEPGRANIVIFNWDMNPTVAVNLASAGLAIGDRYEIIDVQNYYGAPVATGIYSGASVAIPMTQTQVAQPIGNAPKPLIHTPTEFGTFVVRKVTGS